MFTLIISIWEHILTIKLRFFQGYLPSNYRKFYLISRMIKCRENIILWKFVSSSYCFSMKNENPIFIIKLVPIQTIKTFSLLQPWHMVGEIKMGTNSKKTNRIFSNFLLKALFSLLITRLNVQSVTFSYLRPLLKHPHPHIHTHTPLKENNNGRTQNKYPSFIFLRKIAFLNVGSTQVLRASHLNILPCFCAPKLKCMF